ncbi:MAG: LytTR family DNA-binding domain-containing protein, partial [Clostridia bacterium]|nr:LytTR family DNA-binding domain-containing protein [Clostridia bacterium]
MERFGVLIADDDEGMRLIERKMIGMVDGFELLGEARDGNELMTMAERLRPRVIFLDVEMPGKTGVECAKLLQDMDPSMILIFATAHDAYMSDAFEVYAFDYLLKPFKVDRVIKTLERARDRLMKVDDASVPALAPRTPKAADGRLMLHTKEGIFFIDMDDILLVQREDRTTAIYTKDERYVTSENLGETEARLDPEVFFRCHKSYIINLNAINNITPYGRWTYIVKLNGTDRDALITHEKYE